MSSAFDFEGFDPKESLNETLNQISRFVGILSALGCIFNVVVTICLGKSKYIFGKMVIILAIFDFSSHSPLIFTSFNQTSSRISCEIIGSWVGFFGFGCSVIFTTCLAHALYQILKDSNVDSVEQYFKKYVALSLVTGLIAGTLAASLQYKDYHYYGNGKYLCITRHYDGFNWRSLLIVMTPATVSIVGCTFYYIRIIRTLKILNEEWHWGLLVYPLILIICTLPTMIRRLSQLVEIRITSLYRNKSWVVWCSGVFEFFGVWAFKGSI